MDERKVVVRLSRTIRNEFLTRDIFGELPDGYRVEIDLPTGEALLADAAFNADCKNGPESMPIGARLAYIALADQLRAALARVSPEVRHG